jgi:hypothetical protein
MCRPSAHQDLDAPCRLISSAISFTVDGDGDGDVVGDGSDRLRFNWQRESLAVDDDAIVEEVYLASISK